MIERLLGETLEKTLRRVIAFAAVSLGGLIADFCMFLALLQIGLRPELANFTSATLACAIVYFSSTRNVFAYQGRFVKSLFLVYLAYQFALISAASWAVAHLVHLGLGAFLAKVLTLPVTFSSNYVFMRLLLRGRRPSNTATR